MSVSRRLLFGTLVGAALLGCPSDQAAAPPMVLHPSIRHWMQCQECDRGELDSVVALGSGAVPTLRHLLLDGPPADLVSRIEAELQRPLAGGPGTTLVPPAAVVALMLEDYRSGYRVRSSMALGGIGGNDARLALCEGLVMQFPRADVIRAIQAALLALGGACP